MPKHNKPCEPTRAKRVPLAVYEKELRRLQAELVEMQQWVRETGARVLVLCEGRDAAGKGSAIKRMTEYLNPRTCRVVALPTPTEREKSQWYFQRYVPHLPSAGEVVIFDRSWYNRAGVEHVMGFCTDQQYELFLRQVSQFERMLIEDGMIIIKLWFSVSRQEQMRRFRSRASDPMRAWKLSPMDTESLSRWNEYSRAKDRMFASTDVWGSRWVTIESDDKRASRLNSIKHILDTVPWSRIERPSVTLPDLPPVADDLTRPDRNDYLYAQDWAAQIAKSADRQESA